MIWAANPKGEAIFMSPEWEQVTGQKRQQALGWGWTEKIHPDDRASVLAGVEDVLKRRIPFAMPYRLENASGGYDWVIAGAVPSVGPPANSFLGFLGSVAHVLNSSDTRRSTAETEVRSAFSLPLHTTLELIADHLLVARELVDDEAGRTALPHIEQALAKLRLEMIRAAKKLDKRLN
jgi:PAS domain S-box-containing protein